MEELETLKQHVGQIIELTSDEEKYFLSLLKITKVKKRQFVVQPGYVCKYRSYVYKGALRSYLFDNNGQEHTVAIAVEDWWISDYNSYIYQQPATLFVEAIENSTLIQISHQSEEELLQAVPKFERFLRIITQRGFAQLQRRLLSNLSKSARERYEDYLLKYPGIAQRVPQYILASYLGISTVYLSQLRNNKIS